MRIHLRTLGADGGIDIHETIALGGYQLNGLAKDDLAVHAFRLCRGVREVVADVPHVGSPQQGIADSMQQYIGIAVAQKTLRMLYPDTAHPKVATFH